MIIKILYTYCEFNQHNLISKCREQIKKKTRLQKLPNQTRLIVIYLFTQITFSQRGGDSNACTLKKIVSNRYDKCFEFLYLFENFFIYK